VGTGPSKLQRRILRVIRQRDAAGEFSTAGDIAVSLDKDDRIYYRGHWVDGHDYYATWRALKRLEARGLVYHGRGFRWTLNLEKVSWWDLLKDKQKRHPLYSVIELYDEVVKELHLKHSDADLEEFIWVQAGHGWSKRELDNAAWGKEINYVDDDEQDN